MEEDRLQENKELVKRIDEAFAKGDSAFILENLAEEVIWERVGGAVFRGKEEVEQMFEEMGNQSLPEINQDRAIAENDRVIAEGTIIGKTRGGKMYKAAYCDSYVIQEGKVKTLRSYMVQLKKND